MNRRHFIKASGIGLAGLGAAHGTLFDALLARAAGEKPAGVKKLVVIFQRGAMDGLNAVVPYFEKNYYASRSSLAIPEPQANNPAAALDLDGRFALNPALAPFKPLFDGGKLAVIHAVGSPDATRSHFDAQDYMESATPGRKSTTDGWLNRYLQAVPRGNGTPFRGVALAQLTPRSMQGKAEVVSMSNINAFTLQTGNVGGNVNRSFEEMYAAAATDALRGTGRETFDAINFLKKADPGRFKPENGAEYPKARLGESLRQIAQLFKAEVGVEVAFTEMGGWDTHVNQGDPAAAPGRGQFSRLLTEFGQSIAAFHQDMGVRMKDVLVLTMTEFGRTVRQNGTGGTDHGHASVMFALGGTVKGGKVYGDWPGLNPSSLYEGRDLRVTTDFRDVFAEVLTRHMGDRDVKNVLPGYTVDERTFRGFIG